MEHEIDKEMDVIIRSALADESRRVSQGSHFDADDIAAFAANALPTAYRSKMIVHFADCGRCRSILSASISMNESLDEDDAAALIAPAIIENTLPWYTRFFSVVKPVYAMGALVLIFGGTIGFIALQSLQNRSLDISRVSEQAPATAGSASENRTADPSERAASEIPGGSAKETQPTMNSNSSGVQEPSDDAALPNKRATPFVLGESEPLSQAPQDSASYAKEESNIQKDGVENKADNEYSRPELAATPPPPAPPPPPPAAPVSRSRDDLPKPATTDSSGPDRGVFRDNRRSEAVRAAPSKKSKSVSGKQFVKNGNEWRDSTYSGQSLTSVKRNSGDYKKLDNGLRSIAEQFSEPVVVLWKARAYRIY